MLEDTFLTRNKVVLYGHQLVGQMFLAGISVVQLLAVCISVHYLVEDLASFVPLTLEFAFALHLG